jgi:hypothetical protein
MFNLTQGGLSEPRRRLVRLMQKLLFGRIENLLVRDGEPEFDPPPTIIREHKFGGENGSHPKLRADDFLLKDQVVDLFRQFDALGNGVIAVLEVKHGLPFRMLVAEPPGNRAA